MIKLKRVYEPVEKSDRFRILVDRLWPRGISKQNAKVDLWLKDVAPSNQLRKWFGHKPERWSEFQKRYKKELRQNSGIIELKRLVKTYKTLTLVYSAKDQLHNQAVVLKDYFK